MKDVRISIRITRETFNRLILYEGRDVTAKIENAINRPFKSLSMSSKIKAFLGK